MAEVQPVLLQDEDGTTYTIFVETTTPENLPPRMPPAGALDEDDRESYGITEDAIAKFQEIHGTIRAYAWYAIGAFKNFGGAEVEELNLKFGLKIGGKTGVPIALSLLPHNHDQSDESTDPMLLVKEAGLLSVQ